MILLTSCAHFCVSICMHFFSLYTYQGNSLPISYVPVFLLNIIEDVKKQFSRYCQMLFRTGYTNLHSYQLYVKVLPILGIIFLFHFSHSDWSIIVLHYAHNLNFPKHDWNWISFHSFLAICVSSFAKSLLKSFAHYCIEWSAFFYYYYWFVGVL